MTIVCNIIHLIGLAIFAYTIAEIGTQYATGITLPIVTALTGV